ncbi:MAG: 4Fe-4S dicluster domain-containing protein [Gammaproteobacteria bacterium]|nr:MAG: 4Fe-4S dicluster domain-containing protein [Gammaproteobacteria bacterium]
MNKEPDNSRREFLGTAAAAAAAMMLAPGIRLVELATARSPDEPVSDKNRWGLLIDASRCADGCNACVKACEDENGWEVNDPAIDAQWIRTVHVRDPQTGRSFNLPMMCQHCEHPPCADVCPTGASFRRADGIVLVDKHICIGCRYCMMACPYKARSFIHEHIHNQKPHAPRGIGTVESCTLCVHRVDEGRQPACVEACQRDAGGAMLFGDLKDPESAIAKRLKQVSSRQLRADLNLNTGVRYEGI